VAQAFVENVLQNAGKRRNGNHCKAVVFGGDSLLVHYDLGDVKLAYKKLTGTQRIDSQFVVASAVDLMPTVLVLYLAPEGDCAISQLHSLIAVEGHAELGIIVLREFESEGLDSLAV
jgi:hypothetical protein